MKRDAARLSDNYWRIAYLVLVEQYKQLELRLQDRLADLTENEKRLDNLKKLTKHYEKQFEDMQIDYTARLKALEMNENDIKEFEEYWKHTFQNRSFSDPDLEK
jgi:DNA repair ATPase RecN